MSTNQPNELFPLGHADKSEPFTAFLVARLAQGDWGELGREDAQANDQALIEGDRIFSSYQVGALDDIEADRRMPST